MIQMFNLNPNFECISKHHLIHIKKRCMLKKIKNSTRRVVCMVLLIFVIILLATVVNALPIFKYLSPTPINNSIISENILIINSTFNTTNMSKMKFNWNNTNYTLYDDSLIMHINFNNNSQIGENNSKIIDTSILNNTLNIYGAPTYINGKYDGAYLFNSSDGTSDFIRITYNPKWNLRRFTASAWVRTDIDGGRNTFLSNHLACDQTPFDAWVQNNEVYFYSRDGGCGGPYITSGPGTIEIGKWHHIVIMRDDNDIMSIYIDGELKNSGDGGPTPINTEDITIGAATYTSPTRTMNGAIDDVRIYNRSFTAKEIKQLYETTLKKVDFDTWELLITKNITKGATYNYGICVNDLTGENCSYQSVIIDMPPVVSFVSRQEGFLSNKTQNFSCNASDSIGLANITLQIWNSSNDIYYENTTNITGIQNSSYWIHTFDIEDAYHWNCFAADNTSGATKYAGNNKTIKIDTSNINISWYNPNISSTLYYSLPKNLSFNISCFDGANCGNTSIELYSTIKTLANESTISKSPTYCSTSSGGTCSFSVITDDDTDTVYPLYDYYQNSIIFSFDTSKTITSSKIFWNNLGGLPGNYYISYYNGSSWITPEEWKSNGLYQNFDTLYEFELDTPVETNAIMLYVPMNNQMIGLAEFYIEGINKISNISGTSPFYLIGNNTQQINLLSSESTIVTFDINTTESSGNYSFFAKTTREKYGQENTSNTLTHSLSLDNKAPYFTNLNILPNDIDSIDPNTLININISIFDSECGIDDIVFEYYNGSVLINNTMFNFPGTDVYTTSFTTRPVVDQVHSYTIWMKDNVGNTNSTSGNINSFWDCTWNISTNDLGDFFGWDKKINFANFTIINTGDWEYTGEAGTSDDHCNLSFEVNHNLPLNLFEIDDSFGANQYYSDISSGASQTVTLYMKFRDLIFDDSLTVNVIDSLSYSLNTSSSISANLISSSGPYLYQYLLDLETNNNDNIRYVSDYWEIDLTTQEIIFNASIRNGVGNNSPEKSAYNVSFNWTYDDDIFIISTETITTATSTIATDTIELLFANISDGSNPNDVSYHEVKLTMDDDFLENMNTGIYTFNLTSAGYNQSGSIIQYADGTIKNNDSIKLKFICYEKKDNICVKDCKQLNENDNSYDPDCSFCGDGSCNSNSWETYINCPSDCTAPVLSPNKATSSGGGGGGGSAFKKNIKQTDVTEYQHEALFQTNKEYELIRGENDSFILEVENLFDGPLKNLTVDISGFLSKYLDIKPKGLFDLQQNKSMNFTITISAPKYFNTGKNDLNVIIDGIIDKSKNHGEWTSYTYSPIKEMRHIDLYVQEISRDDTELMLSKVNDYINDLKENNFNILKIDSLSNSLNELLLSHDYSEIQKIHDKIRTLKNNAFQAVDIVQATKKEMKNFNNNGIDTPETRRLLLLAQSAIDRGDYTSALNRANDAKLTIALETVGKFNLIAYISNNWLISLFVFICLCILLDLILISLNYFIIWRKIILLKDEIYIISKLIKKIQFQCFEENTMSMEEYHAAANQYEKRLDKIIESKIAFETKKSYFFHFFVDEYQRLINEKNGLIEMLKTTQIMYLEKNKLDATSYNSRVNAYRLRISEIDERLTDLHTERSLAKANRQKRKIIKTLKFLIGFRKSIYHNKLK